MVAELRRYEALAEPVTSPSGQWTLWYATDGRAMIANQDGVFSWAAGAAGELRLEPPYVFVVYDGDEVVWRDDLGVSAYTDLRVTDDGDAILYDDGLPVHSLRRGPIEPVLLGDRAPVVEIRDSRFIRSASGKRTVNRTADGAGLVMRWTLGDSAALTVVVPPEEARELEHPDTWLTWRFVEEGDHGDWRLVLVGPDDELLWVYGRGHVGDQGDLPASQPSDPDVDAPEWLAVGLQADDAYCVTVIHDVDPDEALRRFGALDEEISTATWAQLRRRANYEEVDFEAKVVAAFALGAHTLLVEDHGYEAVNRPDLSRGTFAVSTSNNVNGDHYFLVSRDGEALAEFTDFLASGADGEDPSVLTAALSAMGIDDVEEFDLEDENYLDDLELLCRVAGVRPAMEDVTGPARVAILERLRVPASLSRPGW